jgi:ADP-heptose:LPS heptosyltransferase
LHETQLNIKLLQALDIGGDFSLKELSEYYGLSKLPPLSEEQKMLLSDKRFNLLIHPKSRGSASEWSLENYADLIKRLDTDRYKIFITGTEKEQLVLSEWIEALGDKVTDLTGRFTLIQFMSFIQSCDGLLASSTGPLHLAAATRIHALGLYTSTKSVNSRRWAPVGCKAEFIEAQGNNINLINPAQVFDRILSWTNE